MPNEPLILVPGLWAPRFILYFLKKKLEKNDLRVKIFSYSNYHTLDANVSALAKLATTYQGETLNFLGHSLGGRLILDSLNKISLKNIGKIILLGTPVNASIVASKFAELRYGKALLGETGSILTSDAKIPATFINKIGIISGSKPLGTGMLLANLEKPHDGMVSCAECQSDLIKYTLSLNVTHTSMLFSAAVIKQIVNFIRYGFFIYEI